MKTETKNWILICILVLISFCSHTISAQTTSLIETQRNNNVELGRPLITQTVDSTDMYEFVFYNTDLSFSRLITSVDQILYFQEYSGLPEYLPMQVCVRTKTDDNWSDYGDTCTLTLV